MHIILWLNIRFIGYSNVCWSVSDIHHWCNSALVSCVGCNCRVRLESLHQSLALHYMLCNWVFEFRRAYVITATNGTSLIPTWHNCTSSHCTTAGAGETSHLLSDNLLCHCIFAHFLDDMPGPVKFSMHLFLPCAWYLDVLPRNVYCSPRNV